MDEDFSLITRYERKKAPGICKCTRLRFRLRFNKLVIGGKSFFYDRVEKRVKQSSV